MLTKIDVEAILGIVFASLYLLAVLMVVKGRYPSVSRLLELSTLFNTKGGIIMSLWIAWVGTLSVTVLFGMWVIVKGVDPQHTVVTIILAMLVSQAFGGVSGVLFKTMTGEDPKPPIITETSKVETTSASAASVAPVALVAPVVNPGAPPTSSGG